MLEVLLIREKNGAVVKSGVVSAKGTKCLMEKFLEVSGMVRTRKHEHHRDEV